ncbi:TetR/AcrR family transcriptional regulator [Sulfitobacter sp. S190]|uniref:TetR/AcrR family transcriptional regulator n=1 Tax=Sulfitobacter sp. S190 TaxID=2867022 RepID=UPI0021A7F242|nr:TetR/AcrR family transcriptional regulator [Sulfitobacter sp. S190]UWR21359.1 TetR/AcrR family transcriptional regulator [Sulfitobacter sp. S190]
MTKPKRSRRKEMRPSDIIDAAVQEFAIKGYSATSIGSIAARANIARSTVYLYFDDKEALIKEAFRVRIGDVMADARHVGSAADRPFPELLHHLLDTMYARLVDRDTIVLLRVLIAEGQQFPELTRFYHDTILSAAQDMLSQMLALGVARGEVRPEALAYDPKLIMAPVLMSAIWRLTFEEIAPLDTDQLVKSHMDLLASGLFVHGPD